MGCKNDGKQDDKSLQCEYWWESENKGIGCENFIPLKYLFNIVRQIWH